MRVTHATPTSTATPAAADAAAVFFFLSPVVYGSNAALPNTSARAVVVRTLPLPPKRLCPRCGRARAAAAAAAASAAAARAATAVRRQFRERCRLMTVVYLTGTFGHISLPS